MTFRTCFSVRSHAEATQRSTISPLRQRLTFPVFFQAEDCIRAVAVTGVQTCALPICASRTPPRDRRRRRWRVPSERFRRTRGAERKNVGGGKSAEFWGRRMIKKK